MQRCPVCNAEMGKSEIICMSCHEKIRENEPMRKEERIKGIADMLVIFLALFLFLKGAYALLGIESYQDFVASIGFPETGTGLHYWNASICILTSLGYAVTALGNYLGADWTLKICRFSLLFFVLGQLIIQLLDISEEFIMAEAISVVCFLGFVPLLQYVMYVMSAKTEKNPPDYEFMAHS